MQREDRGRREKRKGGGRRGEGREGRKGGVRRGEEGGGEGEEELGSETSTYAVFRVILPQGMSPFRPPPSPLRLG
jgi:hypothetical protein